MVNHQTSTQTALHVCHSRLSEVDGIKQPTTCTNWDVVSLLTASCCFPAQTTATGVISQRTVDVFRGKVQLLKETWNSGERDD